jgi:transposase
MRRRRFNREFKVETVKLVRKRGMSVAQAGAAFGLLTLPRGCGPGDEIDSLGETSWG